MYLSRLILNIRSREVLRDVNDCHHMHRTIMGAFPVLPERQSDLRAQYGVLHRVEMKSQLGHVVLHVQSAVKPDWFNLPSGYLLDTSFDIENPMCREIGDSLDALQAGQTVVFRLRANPTRREKVDGKEHGRRVCLLDEADQLSWLSRKGEGGGFALVETHGRPDLLTIVEHRVTGLRSETGDQMTFTPVVFEGQLRITNVDRFRNTIAAGLGTGKAFGFGLLSVAAQRVG